MRRIYRKDEDAVSPVIATILMVAITVVLAAVLYVMVIGMGDTGSIETPLGLNVEDRASTTVTIGVASAPTGAKVHGTQIAMTHGGAPTAVTSCDLYYANATKAATYSGAGSSWSYFAGATLDNLNFGAGMKMVVTAGAISNGDVISFSSTEDYYGPSSITV